MKRTQLDTAFDYGGDLFFKIGHDIGDRLRYRRAKLQEILGNGGGRSGGFFVCDGRVFRDKQIDTKTLIGSAL